MIAAPQCGNYDDDLVAAKSEVGRSVMAAIPRAIRSFQGYVCETGFENTLAGIPLKVKTFPHIMQDTDVTVCAHAVCWMIARYHSERYSFYPERLTYDIAVAVKDISEGGTIPSRGVTLGQISEILTSIGFAPEIYTRDAYQNDSFFEDILYAYIESGIPLVAALGSKEHAVAVVGHGQVQSAVGLAAGNGGAFINARQCITSLVVNNDNRLPFDFLPDIGDIDGFVAPLYEKMYLSADNILKIYPKLASGNLIQMPRTGISVARVYMTSSKAYKCHLQTGMDTDSEMRKYQLELPMPKFIWIVEIASPQHYDNKRTEFRWIIDATANQYEKFPFLFIHDKHNMLIHDRALKGNIYKIPFSMPLIPFQLYEKNLRMYL